MYLTAKSMPIHCIVEQANSCRSDASSGKQTDPSVEMDTYAILPSSTLFNEIIRVAMIKLGYSVVEAMGAKGWFHLKVIEVVLGQIEVPFADPVEMIGLNMRVTDGKLLSSAQKWRLICSSADLSFVTLPVSSP